MADLEKSTLNIRTVVAIVVSVVFWVGSLCAVYFPMKAQQDVEKDKRTEMQVTIAELKGRLDKYNPELLDFRMAGFERQIKETNDKADNILLLLKRH